MNTQAARVKDYQTFNAAKSEKRLVTGDERMARSMDEQFGCLFLTSQHRVIAFERLFQGTVDGASCIHGSWCGAVWS